MQAPDNHLKPVVNKLTLIQPNKPCENQSDFIQYPLNSKQVFAVTATILDGNQLAHLIRQQIKSKVDQRVSHNQSQPGLAVVLVGDDPASQVYVGKKQQACQQVGFYSTVIQEPASISEQHLLALIHKLNQDPQIHGILVQLPLPEHINAIAIIEAITPEKDVDGFHPYNVGRLAQRNPVLRPCTPKGVMRLLEHHDIPLRGLDACIVGSSNIVGRPMALELLDADCSVTVTHRHTKDLQKHVSQADLLIVAVGKASLIPGDWIKPGAVVIDVGINRLDNGKLVGDVCFDEAREHAGWITPVPGGVGPMTVACLLENTLEAAENQTQAASTAAAAAQNSG